MTAASKARYDTERDDHGATAPSTSAVAAPPATPRLRRQGSPMPGSPRADHPVLPDGDDGNGAPRPPRITQAMEDYLKGAYRLRDEGGPVSTQRLAEELGISGPSVTNMVKRLHEFGLLRHTRYHGVELTETGEKIALEVIRHHRLLELYLVESLGYPWDAVHDEAERLEHHVSEEMEARIDSALGFPSRDPHGDPIPSLSGTVTDLPTARLLDLPPGATATVARVSDRDPEQLRYLGQLGLYPGAAVTLLDRLPFDGPLRIRVADAEHLIGPPLAAAILVATESARFAVGPAGRAAATAPPPACCYARRFGAPRLTIPVPGLERLRRLSAGLKSPRSGRA